MSALLKHLETRNTGKQRTEPCWFDVDTTLRDGAAFQFFTQKVYRKTITVGIEFSCRDGEFNAAAENADKKLLHYLYKDAVDYLYAAKQAVYERDQQAALASIDALLKELVG